MRLMVFCKAPVPGAVKTRLLSSFSPEQAAEIHTALATETLNNGLALKRDIPDLQLELWCSPDIDHRFFEPFAAQGYELLSQSGDDLGERMARAFQERPGPGLLIGTDCPPVDANYLLLAAQQLASHDVVLAPAEDGGYGLIGLNAPNPHLFAGITWSTDTVLTETLKRIAEAELDVELLPQIWDVDNPPDVARWQAQNLELKPSQNQSNSGRRL